MSHKVSEASHVCAVLDDCAATTNLERLDRFIKRAEAHVDALVAQDQSIADIRPGLWYAAMVAAQTRKNAIVARRAGRMQEAVGAEAESEKALAFMPILAGRS